MKKFLITVMALVMAAFFVSCNSSNSKQTKENKKSEVETMHKTTAVSPHTVMGKAHTQAGTQEKINVKPENGSITIADLYTNRAKYEGKEVKVRGKITKYNEGIMGKNWAHIQDGTKDGENFDLTVTTQAQLHKGDIVTFEGKITLKKDFGAGYFYPVIMQDAKVVK